MATVEVKKFLAFDANGNVVEQTSDMTLEVSAGTTARSIVNLSQLDAASTAAAAALAAEATARAAEDAALGVRIDGVAADLTTETANRTTAIEALGDALYAALQGESASRSSNEAALTQAIADENAARAAQDTVLAGLIADETAARIAADSAEATARAAADTQLQTNIDAEATTARAAEAALSASILAENETRETQFNLLDTQIDAEIARAEAAEGVLTTGLAAEIARAAAAEGVLTTNLATEVTEREADIARLEGLIDAEETSRIADDEAEEAARIAADTTLTTNLAAEATARAAADTQLTTDLAAETAARIAAVGAEATARTVADDALTGDLTAEITRASAAEDTINTALTAEVTRATAEEIAVEQRAKAYADARVQGLKPKDSVDFTMTQFVPAPSLDPEGYWAQPTYRNRDTFTLTDGENQRVFSGGSLAPLDKNGVPASEQVLWAGTGRNPIVFYKRTGNEIEYVNAGGSDSSLPGTAGMSIVDAYKKTTMGPGGSEFNAFVEAGYNVMDLVADVFDVTNLENMEIIYSKLVDRNPDALPANGSLRVAVVQNGIGNGSPWWTGSKELADSEFNPSRAYLRDPAIEAAIALNDGSAEALITEKTDPGITNVRLGVYERKVTGGVASWARSSDFAAGMEVSGAYVMSERGMFGYAVDDNSAEWPNWNTYYVSMGVEPFGPANTGLVFGGTGTSVSAIVGTDTLRATLFNRVGTYRFGDGFVTPFLAQPTNYAVKGNNDAGITVSAEGVGLELASGTGYGPADAQGHEHLKFVAERDDLNGTKRLTFSSPLAKGAHVNAGVFHHHEAAIVSYAIDPGSVGFSTAEAANAFIGSFGNGLAVRFNTTTGRLEAATWDSPDYIGMIHGLSFASDPADPNCPTNYDGTKMPAGFIHVALSGRVPVGYNMGLHRFGVEYGSSDDFALNEVAYVGANAFEYCRFSDIPSGKWAIPVAKRLDDNTASVLDRAPTLKA